MLRTFQNRDRAWAIERRGRSLILRHGKVGGKQQQRRRALRSDYLAERELRKLVRQKVRDGYRETSPPGALPPLDATGQALEQAVVADPDDRAAHMALADWLSEQPDGKLQAWGEHIRLQLALEEDDFPPAERKKLQKRAAELIDANQRDWLGEPLARPLLGLDVSRTSRDLDDELHRFHWAFRRGWLDTLVVSHLDRETAKVLAGSASLRLLRELVIVDVSARGEPFAPLAGSGNLPNVRVLRLEGCTGRASPVPLVGSLPRLGELSVVQCNSDLGGLLLLGSLADLHTLALASLPRYPLDDLASSPALGRLRRLVLNSIEMGNDLDHDLEPIPLDAVARALGAARLPGLAELTVNLFIHAIAGCEEIVRCGILKRLEVLDLSHGSLSDEAAQVLAGCPDLARLKKLVVTGNRLTRAGLQALRRTGAPVESRRQFRPNQFGPLDEFDL